MVGGGEEEGELTLETTPTWIVAVVCFIIIAISLFVERLLHYTGKALMKRNQKPLFEALQKVKEELMLLGFISLMLVVVQGSIQKICISRSLVMHMLPCVEEDGRGHAGRRRLLSGGAVEGAHCKKGKVPLLSLEAIHQLHIFIFVLAVTHVLLSALTVLLGGAKIQQWKHWEDSIQKEVKSRASGKVTHVNEDEFIQEHVLGLEKHERILNWFLAFAKNFYGSVTKSDYTTMRLGFIMTHCKTNPKFNFYKYMVRALEADFKKVVGISWYLWVFVILFLLLNVHGWHTYFWMSFVPLGLLLVVGTKLEHIISQLAHEVAEKHSVVEGDLVVKPSDHHFWFHQPRILIYLIHFILFENAFELAYFFWILTTYGFNSCIMGKVGFIAPRLVICVVIQLLCSYTTLPLYAIVTQMGSTFKKAIFEEHVGEKIVDWAEKVKTRTRRRASDLESPNKLSAGTRMQSLLVRKEPSAEEVTHEPVELNEIQPSSRIV